MSTIRCATLAALAALLAAAPAFAAGNDDAMAALAAKSGCRTCHAIEPGAKGPDGLPPVGPPWRDVAAKYRGQADAVNTLTLTVMRGSNPYESHWKGKVSGLAMPPNAVAITEPDARKLVSWILALEPAKK
ncbi:MAG: c-type cytochrome [Burkholderiales bacterium]|nr:c-type cytochrome [Burkholderiales bacterium]MDE2395011.1 c-type cytochrome [Burkholderiales bacterium]